jgi:hypothetical protein
VDIIDFNGDFLGQIKKLFNFFLLWVNIATGWGHLHASCCSLTDVSFEKRFVFIETVEVVSIEIVDVVSIKIVDVVSIEIVEVVSIEIVEVVSIEIVDVVSIDEFVFWKIW